MPPNSDMFDGLTAWFSSSVNDSTKKLWRDFGGVETDFDSADFVFSADSACPDTQRVFSSTAYENEHLAVFHSHYITACVAAGGCQQVILGQYFLPPQEILNLVRQQVTLAWDDSVAKHQLPKQSSKRNVVIRPVSRLGNTHGSHAPSHPAQGQQVNKQTTATSSQRVISTHTIQPTNVTGQQLASRSEQAARSDGRASNQQSTRSLENRATRLSDGASTSGLNRREQQKVAERQSDPQRTGLIQQQNQVSEMSLSTKQVIHQKRAGEVTTLVHSPPKKRNTIQRLTEQSDSHMEREKRISPQKDNLRTRNTLQVDSINGQSDQQTHNTQRRSSAESSSRTVAEGNSTPRRKGKTTAAIRTSPRHTNKRNDNDREVEKIRNAVVVLVDAHATDNDRSAGNPQPLHNRSDGHAVQRDRTSGPTDIGVCHISQLMKVMASELTDFNPKKNGAEMYRKVAH